MSQTFNTIIQDLHHPDSNTRSQAVFALDKLGNEQIVLDELLAALATETEVMVREDITWALVRRKDQAIQPLIAALQNENWQVRHNAAHVLGKIASPVATDALIGLLQDENTVVVSKTAFALSQIGDVKAIPALVAILDHEKLEVQTTLRDVLEGFGEAAIDSLSQAMKSTNPEMRQQAAEVLGQIPDERSVQLLLQALQDEIWQVRFAAISALTYHRATFRRLIDSYIRPLQNDPNEQVRTLAKALFARG